MPRVTTGAAEVVDQGRLHVSFERDEPSALTGPSYDRTEIPPSIGELVPPPQTLAPIVDAKSRCHSIGSVVDNRGQGKLQRH